MDFLSQPNTQVCAVASVITVHSLGNSLFTEQVWLVLGGAVVVLSSAASRVTMVMVTVTVLIAHSSMYNQPLVLQPIAHGFGLAHSTPLHGRQCSIQLLLEAFGEASMGQRVLYELLFWGGGGSLA